MHGSPGKAVRAVCTDHYRTVVRSAIVAADNNTIAKGFDVDYLLCGEDLGLRLLR
jgi:hypothetical protein